MGKGLEEEEESSTQSSQRGRRGRGEELEHGEFAPRSLHSAARRAKSARREKSGRSGRDDGKEGSGDLVAFDRKSPPLQTKGGAPSSLFVQRRKDGTQEGRASPAPTNASLRTEVIWRTSWGIRCGRSRLADAVESRRRAWSRFGGSRSGWIRRRCGGRLEPNWGARCGPDRG